jgi:hypothetical protein
MVRAPQERPMRHFAVLAAALALTLAGATGARAGAWCAWYDPYTYNCGFTSFQQCLDTVLGSGGYCARNVQDAGPAAPPPKPVRKRHRPH